MRLRHTSSGEESARIVRFAWLASFLATLSLIAILAFAKSAQALTVPGPDRLAAPTAVAPFDPESEEEGEEGFESEECEEESEEEECEEGAGPGSEAPEECMLTSAEPTVFASAGQDRVRLVVRYTTTAPTTVAVDYGLHGSKGSLYLGANREHFAAKGVFRQTESLSEPEMAKAIGAKDFTVQLYAVHAPRSCRRFFERHLTARHATPSGLTWLDPESSARASRER